MIFATEKYAILDSEKKKNNGRNRTALLEKHQGTVINNKVQIP